MNADRYLIRALLVLGQWRTTYGLTDPLDAADGRYLALAQQFARHMRLSKRCSMHDRPLVACLECVDSYN